MKDYQFMSKIDDNSRLAFNLNKVMHEMFLFRMVCAPSTFGYLKEHSDGNDMYMFYLSCLYEKWAHGLVDKLKKWVVLSTQYLDEYEGKWRYYAVSKHLEAVKEGFGDEEDYDEDGSPIERELSDEELSSYTIISDLYHDDWTDIVQETKPEDLTWLRSSLRLQSEIDPVDAIKHTYGVEIDMYKEVRDEDGEVVEMRPMSREERELRKISESVDAEDMYSFVITVCDAVSKVCDELSKMDKAVDNIEEIKNLNRFALNLLDCKY